ncbi:MAG: DUF2239 family protein, partial [Bryobacterales bacterium]|nr:DUF2239 family protein [Bryobacterales bacterium]
MNEPPVTSCTAFAGVRRIASGPLPEVALAAKHLLDRDPQAQILIFDDVTSRLIELDFRGTPAQALERIAGKPPAAS